VALVERRELGLVPPLDHGQNGRVDESDIRVSVAELVDSAVVLGFEVVDHIGARGDIVEKCGQHTGVQAGVDPVGDLYQHRGRDDEGLTADFDQPPARNVIRVAPIE
jgi:hypothetical protein